jgi:hypothetical protein
MRSEGGDAERQRKRRVLREVDVDDIPLNRKLIAWVFVGTGIISAFLWWKSNNDLDWGKWFEKKLSYAVEETVKVTPTPLPKKESFKVKAEIERLVASSSGTYTVYVSRVKTGVSYGIGEGEKVEGASILKVPVLIQALKMNSDGLFPFEKEQGFTLTEADRTPGSGPLQYVAAGTKIDGERLLLELGKKSDNTAWVMLNRIIGKSKIQELIDKMGMVDTNYSELTTTAEDVGKMFMKLYDKAFFGGVQRIEPYLTNSIYEDRIPVGITDESAKIIHKVGTLEDVWSDAGIVECALQSCSWDPFVVVIMNKGIKRSEAEKIVPEIARLVWEYETGGQKR